MVSKVAGEGSVGPTTTVLVGAAAVTRTEDVKTGCCDTMVVPSAVGSSAALDGDASAALLVANTGSTVTSEPSAEPVVSATVRSEAEFKGIARVRLVVGGDWFWVGSSDDGVDVVVSDRGRDCVLERPCEAGESSPDNVDIDTGETEIEGVVGSGPGSRKESNEGKGGKEKKPAAPSSGVPFEVAADVADVDDDSPSPLAGLFCLRTFAGRASFGVSKSDAMVSIQPADAASGVGKGEGPNSEDKEGIQHHN